MRRLIILLAWACASTVVPAQTNAPADVRQLTLLDAIQLALQHNLDLQIDRYNPQISLYNLKANYGDYDPTLNALGRHDHSEAPSQLTPLGGSYVLVPGTEADSSTFAGDLGGKTPWGMTYDLLGNATETHGHTFTPSLTNLNQIPFDNTRSTAGFTIAQPLLKNLWIDST